VKALKKDKKMIKATLFDLDDTLLDRDKSIEPFIRYQYNRIAIGVVTFQEYRGRFIELDNHGYCDKNELYR
jgi:putative hydrolase of the HAD superfamily